MKTLKSKKKLIVAFGKIKGCWKASDCRKEAQANVHIVLPIQFVIQQGMYFVCYVNTACYFYICILNLTK